MSVIRCFEEIESWKKARELTGIIYDLTSEGTFARDFGLKDQLRRASVSVMSNIAEGFERGGNREMLQFLSLAKGSIGEVRSQLYVALDAGYISREQHEKLHEQTCEIGRLISGFMRYLNGSEMKGHKFAPRAEQF
jgi:four helix bundle protein